MARHRRLLLFVLPVLGMHLCASALGSQTSRKVEAEARIKEMRDSLTRVDQTLSIQAAIIAAREKDLAEARLTPDTQPAVERLARAIAERDAIASAALPLRTRVEEVLLLADLLSSTVLDQSEEARKAEQLRKADERKQREEARIEFRTRVADWHRAFTVEAAITSVAALPTLATRTGFVPPWLATALQWVGGATGGAGLLPVAGGSRASNDQRTALLGLGIATIGKLTEDKWMSLRAGIRAIQGDADLKRSIAALDTIHKTLKDSSSALYNSFKTRLDSMPTEFDLQRYERLVTLQDSAQSHLQSVKRSVDQLAVLSSGLTTAGRNSINDAKKAVDQSVTQWPSFRELYVHTAAVLRRQ